MDHRYPLLRALTASWLLFVSALCASALHARSSAWSDGQGGTFKGEPVQALGPYAVFTTHGEIRCLFFRQLSLEECRQFYLETERASDSGTSWATTKGEFTADLVGRLSVVDAGGKKLVEADLKARREPKLVVLYYGSGWGGNTYATTWRIQQAYNRLKRLYGDAFEMVFVGVRHDAAAQQAVAVATQMSWLIANYEDQKKISVFSRYEPAEGERMVILTDRGAALYASDLATTQQQARFFDRLSALLDTCDPENQHFWPDCARYLAVTRAITHPRGAVAPVVVNRPFDPVLLRKAGIERITAELAVSADGKVQSAVLLGDSGVPERLREKTIAALVAQWVVLPGLLNGGRVAGSCQFDYLVPLIDENTVRDRRWVHSDPSLQINLREWLLLRPIPVPESQFSVALGADERGAIKLSSFKVGPEAVSRKSQLTAFDRDFFADTGAATVVPTEGQTQMVDGETYQWERVACDDGLVDFANRKRVDYCIGYAYAEFESEKAGTALLGLGSDDGVKIWLNGELVKDSWVQRITHIDEDLVPLKLLAGRNRILIKIQNMKGDWSFFMRIRK